MSWRLRVPHRLPQRQEAKPFRPRLAPREEGLGLEHRGSQPTQPSEPPGGVAETLVSPDTTPPTPAQARLPGLQGAPKPRPCPARLSLAMPDLLCMTARVTLLWLGLIGKLSL